MLNRDYEGQNCSIARALEVVGERWTLLIIRDLLLGLHRFDELQESLGIARNVLSDRLNRLVGEGVLERVLYSERPERYEYQLTKKGLDLNIALTALRQWGDKYLSEKPPRLQLRKVDRTPVDLTELEARGLFAQVLVAPLAQGGERDVEVEPFLRQLVLVPLRALAVEDALEHAFVDQPVEPVGQNVAGDSEALLEFVEAVQAEQDVADDQQRPALADNLERS